MRKFEIISDMQWKKDIENRKIILTAYKNCDMM